jgi:hypothetical protein
MDAAEGSLFVPQILLQGSHQRLVWNDRIDAPRPGPDDRLGTRIAKAYTYSLIAKTQGYQGQN